MPPSEEGGGCLHKGFEQADGRRDTQNLCESSRYRRELIYNDTCIILCAPTPWCKQQPRVLSPSVAPLNPFWRASSLLRGSRGGYRRTPRNLPQREPRRLPPQAAEFSKVRTAVKPAEAGCPHPPAALSAAIAKTAKSPGLDMQNNIIIINHFTRLEKPL